MAKLIIEVDGGWIESYSLKWLVQDIESQTSGRVTSITRQDDTKFDIENLRQDWWENE